MNEARKVDDGAMVLPEQYVKTIDGTKQPVLTTQLLSKNSRTAPVTVLP
jgi:hypothetical protein